jgi:hypothetical protein
VFTSVVSCYGSAGSNRMFGFTESYVSSLCLPDRYLDFPSIFYLGFHTFLSTLSPTGIDVLAYSALLPLLINA